MSNTRVVNIRKESCDVYIGRAGQGKDGYFGNPFRLEATMTRGGTLDRYRKYFYYRLSTDEKFRRRIGELQGKTLGCFCKPNPCHGDIIKEYLERMEGCTDEIAIERPTGKEWLIQFGKSKSVMTFSGVSKSLCDEPGERYA